MSLKGWTLIDNVLFVSVCVSDVSACMLCFACFVSRVSYLAKSIVFEDFDIDMSEMMAWADNIQVDIPLDHRRRSLLAYEARTFAVFTSTMGMPAFQEGRMACMSGHCSLKRRAQFCGGGITNKRVVVNTQMIGRWR